MKKYVWLLMGACLCSCQEKLPVNVAELLDGDPTTCFVGQEGTNRVVFDDSSAAPVQSYKIYSSGEAPVHDPASWTLKGSFDGKNWIVVDERKEQSFCSRYQEITCSISKPSNYKQYMLEAATASGDTLMVGDVLFYDTDLNANWNNFKYPAVDFKVLDPETKGASIYSRLVQDPDAYIRYHARKVAEILFYADRDTMNDVKEIEYLLKDYQGVSAKDGDPAHTTIVYSTQHIEKSANESLYKLDFETRGVLYHELVHAYQFEPKGIGTYSTNKTFWACIEGLADAVRAEAGYFDMSTRKPGGNWMDGYRTTGFFLQWLTTKDPDAIRKFHETVRDIDDEWSFDKAMKRMFGEEASIEGLWDEYQAFLTK